MIGQTVSHYKITAKLGAGGMGEVYLATDLKLDRPVALKFLPEGLARDPEARERLLREAKAASQLNHPNILTIHAVEEADDPAFIVMEYVAGQTLRELIATGNVRLGQAVKIAQDVASALEAAHEAGIVHRDIKPDNILIGQDGRTRVGDFGLAKTGDIGRLSGPHILIGTVSYMSPEQTRGEPVDHRTDVWALGVVLYEMITGQRPFGGDYEQAVIYAILNEEPKPLSELRPDVPANLEIVVGKALQKIPADRYASAAELAADLAASPDASRLDALRPADRPQTVPSVAVLPFADMSPGKDQEYLCDGITEQLINDLSKVDGLRVVARTSAFAFKGKDEDVRTIGRRLSVGTVLEGSVRKAGNRLRVTAKLVNVADGYHRWSETYDRKLKDVFAIQDELAQTIVGTLRGRLIGDTIGTGRPPTDNIEAYNEYLRGLYHWNRRTQDGLEKGLEHFRAALEIDPRFALAHVGIADTYIVMQSWGRMSFEDYMQEARAAAQRALELDPELAGGQAALAMIERDAGRWREAGAAFERAVALNPGYATARQWYGIYLLDTGHPDGAGEQLRRAIELDPLSLAINNILGWYYYLTRRFTDAVEQLERTLELDPGFVVAHELLFWCRLTMGKCDKAAEHAPVWLAALGGTTPSSEEIRAEVARSGAQGLRVIVGDVLRERWEHGLRLVAPGLAAIHGQLGHTDEAFGWLERARAERLLNLAELRFSPDFDPLRTDPRFETLIQHLLHP